MNISLGMLGIVLDCFRGLTSEEAFAVLYAIIVPRIELVWSGYLELLDRRGIFRS